MNEDVAEALAFAEQGLCVRDGARAFPRSQWDAHALSHVRCDHPFCEYCMERGKIDRCPICEEEGKSA